MFAGIAAIAAILIGTPVLSFILASRGRFTLSLVVTVPAVLLYFTTIIIALRS